MAGLGKEQDWEGVRAKMGNVEGWSESQQWDQEGLGSVLVVRDYLGATSISGPAQKRSR